MHRTVLILILAATCFAGVAAATDTIAAPYDDTPHKGTPRKLQEAWLRFHEVGLCQDVDAAFVFDDSGMKIWSRIGSDRIYLRFQELFAPLRNLYRVELYTNRSREEKEAENGDNPPPSLWQNHELRSNLGDRAAQLPAYDKDQITLNDPSQTDVLLKQRLLIYAEQTLSRNRKMEHYALDLFALARMALDSGIPSDLRSKALAICLAHAKSLEKSIGKLASDLAQAIPGSAKGESGSPQPGAGPHAENTFLPEKTERIYAYTQSIAQRVHRFIYPEYYTVELEELRNPSLLEALRTLQRMVLELQQALAKSGINRR
jgi:hypothetical protein